MPEPRKDCETVFYKDHCWTPDDLLLGISEQGDIFAIENQDIVWKIKDKSTNISKIFAYPMGFALGYENGFMRFYEKGPKKNEFNFLRTWTHETLQGIRIIAMAYHEVSANEKILAIANKNNNITYLNLIG